MSKPNKSTYFYVRDEGKSTGINCPCGSWLDHWKNCSRSQRAICAVDGCTRVAERAKHVQSAYRGRNEQWWIAPFCKEHNSYRRRDKVFLDSRIALVSATNHWGCRHE